VPGRRRGLDKEDMPTLRGHSSSFVSLEGRPKYIFNWTPGYLLLAPGIYQGLSYRGAMLICGVLGDRLAEPNKMGIEAENVVRWVDA